MNLGKFSVKIRWSPKKKGLCRNPKAFSGRNQKFKRFFRPNTVTFSSQKPALKSRCGVAQSRWGDAQSRWGDASPPSPLQFKYWVYCDNTIVKSLRCSLLYIARKVVRVRMYFSLFLLSANCMVACFTKVLPKITKNVMILFTVLCQCRPCLIDILRYSSN